MDRRVILFLLLSVGILGGWLWLQERFYPQPPKTPAAETSPKEGEKPPKPAQAAPAEKPSTAGTAAPAKPATVEAVPEERTTITRPGRYTAIFTNHGAAPVQFTLLDPQYKEKVDGHDRQVELIHPQAGSLPYLTYFNAAGDDSERSDAGLPADAGWKLVSHSDTELVYAVDAGPLHVEKRWTLPEKGYALDLVVKVENRGDKPLHQRLLTSMDGWHNPEVKAGGLLSFGRHVNLTEGLCDVAGKLKHDGLEALLKKPVDESGEVHWTGTGGQFFITALAYGGNAQRCHLGAEPDGRIHVRAAYAEQTLAPGASTTYPMAAFAGPKLLHDLDAVAIAGTSTHLGDAVNYTLEFIARPMLWVLMKLHAVIPNWGVAIILITILLKLLTFWPQQKSMQSMKEMAKLKPKIEELKKRFGDDKTRLNQETMALYKQHGVNPLGSCLPMLLQMPIYIAFYSMLGNAVQLYRSVFIPGLIEDMTAPYWPLAVVTGVLMFLQQWMSPTSQDPQQKQMMYMMPIMYGLFTLFLPAGLTLYIFANSLLTMLQQWWINHHDAAPKPARS